MKSEGPRPPGHWSLGAGRDAADAISRRADDPAFCLALGKAFICGKIHNCRTRCYELDGDNDHPDATAAVTRLNEALKHLETAVTSAEIMLTEARAARTYFGVVRLYLRPPWTLPARERHPPPDPVNALLSLLSVFLHESCRAALETAGLDPACGFLHSDRPGRLSLALDLMEEFRPVIADSAALTLVNKHILTPADFGTWADKPGVRLRPEGWRAVADQYTHRLNTRIHVPGRATKTTYQKWREVQARQLRQVMLGHQECYLPFLSR